MVPNEKERKRVGRFVEENIKAETDQALLDQLREGIASERQGEIDRICFKIYEKYRAFFFKWASQFKGVDDYVAGDIYQQTFTVFFLNVRNGKLDTLSCRLSTYLFGIGKRVLYEYWRKNPAADELDDLPQDVLKADTKYMHRLSREESKRRVLGLMNNLGEKCKRVLTLRYFHKFSMDAIAEELNYSSSDVAKKTRYECIKKLRNIFKQNGYDQEDFLEEF